MSWQALRDVARGQARYWPEGQVNAVYPNDDGADLRDLHGALPRVALALLRVDRRPGDTAGCSTPSATQAVDWLWSRAPGRHGTPLRPGRHDNGDPVYGYDLSVAADTASNALAVNAFNRVAQLAEVAGDTAQAATQRARSAQLAAAVNAVLRRRDGSTSTAIDADGAQSGHASQEANALALAYGVVPAATGRRGGLYVAGLGIDVAPNHGLELLRGLAAAGLHRGHGAYADRRVHSRLGPHRGGRRHLHLGDVAAERPDRGLHVARLGVLRAGGRAGDPAGRVARCRAQPRRDGPRLVAPPRHGPRRGPRGRCRPLPARCVSWQRRGPGA